MEDIYISKKRQIPQEIQFDFLDEQAPPPEPQKEEKTKKKHRFLKVIASILAVIFIFSSVFIFTFALFADYTREDLDSNKYVSATELKNNPFITNILLMGVDGSVENSSRSDSMILLSIDLVHTDIKMSSFLRDSWVDIPSKSKKGKLNSACSIGGPQLVVDTIEYNFNVDIDHYVMVDFGMFTRIIDSFGGVEVEVTQKEASFINRTTRQTVNSGTNVLLNGEEALVYCRIRKLDSDYMRTFRQRKVITALIEKVKKTDISTLIQIVNDVFPLIKTDLNAFEITGLAYKSAASLLLFDIKQTRVPLDEHMKPSTINGQWVEVIDLPATKEYLQEFIYTNNIKEED